MGGSWKNFQELDRGKSNKSPLTDILEMDYSNAENIAGEDSERNSMMAEINPTLSVVTCKWTEHFNEKAETDI